MNLPLTDLHMHTTFCDGKASAEEMLLAAIAKGYHTVGLSGHSYTAFDTSYCMTDEAGYLAECRRLKDKYAGEISLQIGMEVDAFAERPRAELDFTVGSVHYFRSGSRYFDVDASPAEQERALTEGFGGSLHRLIDSYFSAVVEMADRLRPDMIGHFDLLTKFSERGSVIDVDDRYYRGAALDALTAALSFCPRLEINTGAVSRGYRSEAYPSDELILRALSLGARLILSSDAHHPSSIGYQFGKTAERLLSLGCTEVDVRRGDRFEQQPLI